MTVLEHLQDIIKEQKLKVNQLDEKALNLPFKDLGLDSLDLYQIVVLLEKRLNIQLSDEVLMRLRTINDLLAVIEKLK